MNEVYTVRMGFIDTNLWSAHEIVDLYKPELTKAGFKTSQLPSVNYPETQYIVKKGEAFAEAKSIHISVPVFGEFDQTRDTRVPFEQDKAALAEYGKAFTTVFTWNLCAPEKDKDPAGTLRNIMRTVKPADGILKLSPKVSKFADAPLDLTGYPLKQSAPVCSLATPAKVSKKNFGLWALGIGVLASILSKGKV